MRLTVAALLSCAAFGFVGANPAEQRDPPKNEAEANRLAANDQANRKPTPAGLLGQRPNIPLPTIPLASFVPGAIAGLIPGGNLASLIPIPMPSPIQSLFGNPPPTHTSKSSRPTNSPAKGTPKPNLSNPRPAPPGKGGPTPQGGNPKDKEPKDQVKCTNQEVSCEFLRKQAFDLQNDDDECLRIATSFDDQGKIDIKPLAQGSDTVVYGITTDGLTASAWCNDIGWTLRRIYSKCKRGKSCFGGQGYAARNSVFMVSVGPKTGGPKIVNKYPTIEFYDIGERKGKPGLPSLPDLPGL